MIPAFCGWHNLGDDLQLKILSIFTQGRGDKDSLNVLLQTSHALRILVSSLIHKIEIRSIDALATFPRHATITAMELNLIPQLGLELPALDLAPLPQQCYPDRCGLCGLIHHCYRASLP